ncbi:DUF423 domain-containing protein [Sinomicrobium sp. M5D2P17]
MKTWSFQAKSNPKEISEKLKSSLGRAHIFALNENNKNSLKFRIRKRILFGWDTINAENKVILKGKIFQINPGNGSNVEISFTKHPILKLVVYFHIILILGLLAGLIFKSSSTMYIFIFGGILSAIGTLIWLHLEKKFDKNVQEYRALISGILEL